MASRDQKVGGPRRQLAKVSSLILLQNEIPHTNVESVWLNALENHTPSAHHNFKQTEKGGKKKRQKLQSFPKEDFPAISEVLRELSWGKIHSFIQDLVWMTSDRNQSDPVLHKPSFVKTR